MNDKDMRQLLSEAFRRRFGREGTLSELQCVQAVAWLETSYGRGWKPPGNGSWNFGAMQATRAWGGATFMYTDTHPNTDGTSTPYSVAFRKYPTAIAGAEDLVRIVYQSIGTDRKLRSDTVLPAATSGNTLAFSTAMRSSGYYEGFGATIGERIGHHHDAVVNAIRKMAKALGEPLPKDIAAMPIQRPTIKLGSLNRAVTRELQELLNRSGTTPPLVPDGGFGAKTDAAVRMFQRSHALKVDGEVGAKTWAALVDSLPFESDEPPDVA